MIILLTVNHGFATPPSLVYQAHCLSLKETHSIDTISLPRLVFAKKIENKSPQGLIQFCKQLQKADNKGILVIDFESERYNHKGRMINFLRSYVPATESNSAIILNDLPLLDELSEKP